MDQQVAQYDRDDDRDATHSGSTGLDEVATRSIFTNLLTNPAGPLSVNQDWGHKNRDDQRQSAAGEDRNQRSWSRSSSTARNASS